MSAEAINPASEKASVVAALQRASAVTGSDFRYLLSTAMRESSLQPQAKSPNSSATGLFQFVAQTWLGAVKEFGTKFGLGSYAAAINKGDDGRYHVQDADDRKAVLALRDDPQLSALMAGELAQQSKAEMQSALGREVCGGELYAAHFLGPDGACRLIRMCGSTPEAEAANEFPQAASANKSVFYRADGSAKSVREVYDWALRQPAVHLPRMPVATAVAANQFNPGTDYSGLLASLWTQSSRQFLPGQQANFSLTPDLLDILASVSPVAKDGSGS